MLIRMVNSFKPKSEFLRKYVKDFSTFEKGCDLRINFVAFPPIGTVFAFLKNADLKINEEHLQIIPTLIDSFNSIILGKYTKPVFITYDGYVNEISVNFHPLGINYFFDDPYSVLAPGNFQKLNNSAWLDFGRELMNIDDIEKKLQMFEDFLIKKFKNPGLEKLQRAVDLLASEEGDYKVSEVAEAAGVNERTLHRLFLKYVGCSPIKFKRIVRFRNVICQDVIKRSLLNITALGYENKYYDSSHFVREYKAFTGKNPKSFFKDVEFLGNSSYPCIIL